jgi:spore coat protein A
LSITRRRFLQQSGIVAAAAVMPQGGHRVPPKPVRPVLDPDTLTAFVDPLPIPGVALSTELRPSPDDPKLKIPYYRLAMRQFQAKVHRDMKPTRLWGIGSSSPGPTLEAESGKGMLVEWVNELPGEHFLPIDHSLHGAESDKPDVRSVIHLHGAKAPPESDGYPENWYVPGKSATYYYPNHQDAALLWYHDHTLGINRLNVLAGLFGLYILRDPVEEALNLPRGKYEVPLVLCDRSFDLDGQLYYPVAQNSTNPWVPEFLGNTILANGKLLPYLDVDPRKYRFRVLNAANSRFLRLGLLNGQMLHQIGTDQGLLPAPVTLKEVTLAPGERADLVLDFSDHAGEQMVLKNDFASPIVQFRVARGKVSDPSSLPAALPPVAKIAESDAVKTRDLKLGEIDDLHGDPVTVLLNDAHWKMPVTEDPVLNSVEIWNLMNVTDDVHPIHLHLVRFQILDRRRFDAFAYQNRGVVRYWGAAIPPEPNEAGWKDTVRATPGMVTRIIMRFEGFTGRYVWHCHILEHEDNEMMRPYDVIAGR